MQSRARRGSVSSFFVSWARGVFTSYSATEVSQKGVPERIPREDLSPARPGTLNHLRQYKCCWELCCKICSSSFEIGKHDGNKNHAAPSLTAAARGSRSEWPDRRTLAVLTRCRLWVNGAKNHRPLCKEQANRDPSDEDVIRLGLP